MNVEPSHPKAESWRELYTAALFETDRSRISARIAGAEQAIVARARELFSTGNDTIEGELTGNSITGGYARTTTDSATSTGTVIEAASVATVPGATM